VDNVGLRYILTQQVDDDASWKIEEKPLLTPIRKQEADVAKAEKPSKWNMGRRVKFKVGAAEGSQTTFAPLFLYSTPP
jgi:hypothetical protein